MSDTNESKSRLAITLLIAVVSISFAAIFFRKALPTHPLVASGIRLLIASALLSPFIVRAIRNGNFGLAAGGYAAVGGALYAVHFGAWVWSLELTSVAASVTLVTATPLFLAIVALISGRDRPTRAIWMALSISAMGVFIIGGGDLASDRHALLGDALALLGALAMAIYLWLCRRLGDFDVFAFTGVATLSGGMILAGICALAGIDFAPASTEALGYLALAAVLPQVVGHSALTWSLRHATPTVVGIATLGEPVGATILAFFILGEAVPWIVALGCITTLCGLILALLSTRHQSAGR